MDEVPLQGGRVTEGVVRVGDTVRRPLAQRAAFVHAFLEHLEAVGFDGAPRFLGVDNKGRASVTYIDGEALTEVGTLTDAELRSAAVLLRRLHDAAASAPAILRDGHETVIHGDAGPWNMIWQGHDAIALIDFDEARPGTRLEDLGYFAWKGLRLKPGHLDADEQHRRLRVLTRAYGAPVDEELLDAIDRAYVWMHEKGLRESWPATALEAVADERAWFLAARPELS